jgi:hypothetical protein
MAHRQQMMNEKAAEDQGQEVHKALAFLNPEPPEGEQNQSELDGKRDKSKINLMGLYLRSAVFASALIIVEHLDLDS